MEIIADIPSLRTVWTAMSGQASGHAPPLVGSLLIYSLAFLTCLVLQQFCKRFLPSRFYSYAADFIFTMLVCGFPYGHGTVRANFGHSGYVFAAVTMVTLAFLVFEGVPSPLGVFVRYLRGEESLVGLGVRVALQVLAAFMSYRLVFAICCLEVTAEHQVLLEGSCESDLKVPVIVGCLIEFGSVLYDTWLCHQQLLKSPFLDTIIKNINGALLVCAGVHLTGMYMHPAMATGMTFNCKGTDTLEHIAVYWVASFLGCFAGVRLDSVLRLPRAAADPVAMKKKKDDHDVIQQGQGDRNLRSGNGRGKERARERRQAGGERTSHSNNNNNNNNIKHAKKNKKHN